MNPMTFDYDLVCIGSGPAGQRGAVQAAKFGKRVAIIEKHRAVGGVCLHTGTIPSKTFREAVLSFANIANGLSNGVSPDGHEPAKSTRCKPNAGELFGRVGSIVDSEITVQDDQLSRNDIDVIEGAAVFTDPHTLCIDTTDGQRTITSANILISVGTKPSPPRDFAIDGQFVINSDDIFKVQEIPRSVIVIGCGVIGIEYASMFAALGLNVTVVDGRKRPLEFLDGEIIDELVHQMRDRGVLFRLGETVEAVDVKKNGRSTVVVSLGSGKRLAATSSEQGRLAACAAFGVNAKPMSKHFPIGVYSVPEVSMVGAPEHELTEKKIPYETGVAWFREIARGHILGDNTGFLKLNIHREDRRLLGVHAIGTGATELIHIGQCVYAMGGGLDYFLETVFNYPTLAECYKVAALDAHNKLLL